MYRDQVSALLLLPNPKHATPFAARFVFVGIRRLYWIIEGMWSNGQSDEPAGRRARPRKTHSTPGGEGEITRRSAPRPCGAALRALSPLRRCCRRLIEAAENAFHAWRRG